jgi:hypothetical protein
MVKKEARLVRSSQRAEEAEAGKIERGQDQQRLHP